MADIGTVIVAWGVSAGVSGFSQVKKGSDPFPVLMASGLGLGATAMIGQFLDWQLAAAIALVTMVGVIVYRGRPILDGLSALINAT